MTSIILIFAWKARIIQFCLMILLTIVLQAHSAISSDAGVGHGAIGGRLGEAVHAPLDKGGLAAEIAEWLDTRTANATMREGVLKAARTTEKRQFAGASAPNLLPIGIFVLALAGLLEAIRRRPGG